MPTTRSTPQTEQAFQHHFNLQDVQQLRLEAEALARAVLACQGRAENAMQFEQLILECSAVIVRTGEPKSPKKLLQLCLEWLNRPQIPKHTFPASMCDRSPIQIAPRGTVAHAIPCLVKHVALMGGRQQIRHLAVTDGSGSIITASSSDKLLALAKHYRLNVTARLHFPRKSPNLD